eukprot:92817-Pelagomonas_calceolata.AAC.2
MEIKRQTGHNGCLIGQHRLSLTEPLQQMPSFPGMLQENGLQMATRKQYLTSQRVLATLLITHFSSTQVQTTSRCGVQPTPQLRLSEERATRP